VYVCELLKFGMDKRVVNESFCVLIRSNIRQGREGDRLGGEGEDWREGKIRGRKGGEGKEKKEGGEGGREGKGGGPP